MPNNEINSLLTLLEEAYVQPAWHGPNLRGSLRGIDARKAAWRPKPGRHNIWDEVVHAAYWKYSVKARIVGEEQGLFAVKGKNWFTRPKDNGEKVWRADVALLDEMHRQLTSAVACLPPEQLDQTIHGSKSIAR